MARTAPVPDIPPIPGMCPSIAVLAGGGALGGGSGGSAGDGSGDVNAGGSGSGDSAQGDQRGAPDYTKYPGCGYASHPVDVVTGRAFTHPITDLALPGPLPFELKRMYSSKASSRDVGLGPGWAHTLGWEVEVQRRRITVWNEQGIAVDFPVIPVGGEALGPWGWVLRREPWGFAVDADDGLWHLFSAGDEAGKRFKLTAIQDRNKNRIAITYEDDRLVEVVDSAGRTIRVLSTKEGRIASFQVKNAIAEGRWIAFATYGYDDSGRLVSATDADGFSARYGYDDADRLTDDADRTGLTFHFRYDEEGRCIESWGDYPGRRDPSLVDDVPKFLQDGVTRVKGIHHCKFEYFPEGYSEVADSTQVRRFFGTVHGTLSKSVDGGGVTTASYREDGHLIAQTDALGALTSYERDARGRVLRVIDPLGRMTMIVRDAAGLATEVVDPAGGLSTAVRDRQGNATTYSDVAGGVTALRYDARGLITEMTSPSGAKTSYAYDEQGNRTTTTLPSGAVWRSAYDALGRRQSVTDPLGATTRYSYSARGDLLAVHDAIGGVMRYTYDGERHLTRSIDPKGRALELVWGGYRKLCDRRDANGNVVRLRYDLEGSLVEVHNERGEIHRLEYDGCGRLVGETTFDGRALRYKNDLLGRPLKIIDGLGRKREITYDLAGQILTRELPNGAVESFEHDSLGAVVRAAWPGGEVRFERDGLSRIVRETQILGETEHSVMTAYDAEGRRIGRQTSRGHAEAITRDLTGARQRTVLDETHVVEHQNDALGRETGRAFAGGGRIESAYDAMGRLSVQRALGPADPRRVEAGQPAWIGGERSNAVAECAYRYDWDGELIELWEEDRGRTEYQYDAIGQLLVAAPETAQAKAFGYDPSGNLYERGSGAEIREYGPGSRLVRKGSTRYDWDDDGRLVAKRIQSPESGKESVWRYQWNSAGYMESAAAPDGTLIEFVYDPFARRVQKRVSRPLAPAGRRVALTETLFVWDGDVLVHEIKTTARAGGDPVVEERTYCFEDEGFAPTAHREEGEWAHYLSDPIGTPRRLIGEDGRIVGDVRRGVWGEGGEAQGRTTPLRFQGQYADDETGLSYNGHRYYDPETSSFTSADPSGLFGGVNSYAYARNSLSWIDPSGLIEIHRSGAVTVDAYPGPPAGGKEHLPLHAHVRDGSTETRVLMEDYYKKGKRVGCAGDVYPGDPAMTKGMRKMMKDPALLPTLQSRTRSVFDTGSF